MKKLISVILLLCMLLTVFAACKGDKKPPVDTSDEQQETEEPNYLDTLPSLDLEGAEYKMLISSQHETFYMQEEETGDIVESACFARNLSVEDRYKCEIFYVSMDGNASGQAAFQAAVQNSLSAAQKDAFNLVIGQNYYCLPLVSVGAYHNLRESEVLDLDAEWAHSAINNNGTINGKLYGASGSFVISQLTHALALYYNKNIFEDYGFAEQYDIYEIVRQGKWTYDLFYQMVISFDDVDKDDPAAVWGLDRFYHAMVGLHVGFGNNPVTKNAEGEYTLDNYYNDALEQVYSKLRELYNDHAAVAKSEDLSKATGGNSASMMDHLLFCMNYLHGSIETETFGKSESHELGILPAPKYTEDQENYYTRIMRGDLYYIPKNADFETAALLTEALNYETYKIVYPEYWDKVVEFRAANTAEDREMVQILASTVYSSFAMYFTQDLNSIDQQVAINVDANAASMSVWWGNNERLTNKKLERLLESYE